jgi:hypothetical protein
MEVIYHHLTLYDGNYTFHTQPRTEFQEQLLLCAYKAQIEHAFQDTDKPNGLNFSLDMLDRTDEDGAFS